MRALQTLETKLDSLLGTNAPVNLSENSRRTIIEYLPWVNVVLGALAFWVALSLWHWAHPGQAFIDYANSLSPEYGRSLIHRQTIGIWLGVVSLVAEGLLLVAAYPGTRDRKKHGWDLLFYAALLNIAYSVFILFTDYGSTDRLLLSLITSTAGLYLLFQVRSYYSGRRAVKASTARTKRS